MIPAEIPNEKGISYGISVGRLIKDQGSSFPTRFEGQVILFDDGIFRRQIASKLTGKWTVYDDDGNNRFPLPHVIREK